MKLNINAIKKSNLYLYLTKKCQQQNNDLKFNITWKENFMDKQ